jgi:signal transduction histidine kinase
MNESFFDKIIGKLDPAYKNNIQAYINRVDKERSFLETVFNTINEGVIVVDSKLNIKYTNSSAQGLLGLPENFNEQRISRFLKELEWNSMIDADGNWNKISRREIEVLYPLRRILLFYLLPLETDTKSAVIILHDITESRENTQEIIESEKMNMISMLAAGVAHEIGNPLNSLNIHLQLLQRHLADINNSIDEETSELLNIANSEVERLDKIIHQFLQAVRSVKPDLHKLNIAPILIETLKLLRNDIENKCIDIKCSWENTLPLIMGDENQLKQAFFNIIKNAIQSMSQNGNLDIECTFNDDFLILSFIDTGKGISKENIGHVSDAYFTTKKEGNGLGLMVVERIIREHGAELAIESEVGKGTTFTIKFPRSSRKIRLLQAPPAASTARS